ncbi:MAG: MarR family transcriptional regulator [Dehalococcoidia bacterium]|nr:MarR family transcriptional regulator [Dehalococcoidia bacterium]
MERDLGELGLTVPRAEVLWRLRAVGPMTQRALSQALQCTPRNVTGLVDALEAGEFVTRERHPGDRRATLVTLTDRGTKATDDWEAAGEQFASTLFADVPSAALPEFMTTIDSVLARLGSWTASSSRAAESQRVG